MKEEPKSEKKVQGLIKEDSFENVSDQSEPNDEVQETVQKEVNGDMKESEEKKEEELE